MNERFLLGRTAVITGAKHGLGRAMALALGKAGARLALVDHQHAEETLALARAADIDAEMFITNVCDEIAVARLPEQVSTRFGKPQILINSAGVAIRKPVVDFTLDEWNRVMVTNVTGPFLLCRAFVPLMKDQGWGRIINMTSIMSHVASAGRSAYAASKAALLAFTKALAMELIEDRINVVGISPGFFATEMTAGLRGDAQASADLLARIPMNRWGSPEDVGQLALFLCSDAASYMTGSDVVIDGGWLAQ